MVDPVAFSLLSEVWVLVLHPLDHHDREVIYGVSWGVEMGSQWFLKLLVANVTAVSIEADMERVLCLSHILQFAFPALDEVDDVPRLAGCSYVVGTAGGSAHGTILGPDVLAGSASGVTAWTASLSLATVRCQVSLAQH